MEEEKPKTWIDEMIERESIPKTLREETIDKFCERWGITPQTYQYQRAKEEHQKKILEISLNVAKREVPEILKVLIDNAKSGKEKSIEMYLDYVIKLAKNLDITTQGEKLASVDLDDFLKLYAKKHFTNNNRTEEASGEADIPN